MPGQYLGLVRQKKEFLANTFDQQGVVAARQVCPADTARKQNIASDQKVVRLRVKADASRTMSRDQQYAKLDAAEIDFVRFLDEEVRLHGFCFKIESEVPEEVRIGYQGKAVSMICHLRSE